ncbi:MAG: haloacid dehalogenase [Anaerolineales bacterium]|nr:HAD-IIA family hydrolase [Anaerolineae bacterium]PWB50833.1 MAG: haloacid dehalogenase [Anaerolineales bacterium]
MGCTRISGSSINPGASFYNKVPQIYKVMQTVINRSMVQGMILDMDGVLWRGDQAIGDLQRIFEIIDNIGWKVTFATNNATRNVQQYIDGLASFHVRAQPWQVITSATAVTHTLTSRFQGGGAVHIVGEQGVIEACAEHGFYQADTDVKAVIVGFDRNLTYEKLRKATLLIRSGVLYIGTNPDLTFPTPEGLIPGAGSILAAVTAATGIQPVVVGKPEPLMYQIALERMAIPAANVLVVGDRPETDIACAQQMGCLTALVLSGVTNAAQAAAWQPVPDIITADLVSVIQMFSGES